MIIKITGKEFHLLLSSLTKGENIGGEMTEELKKNTAKKIASGKNHVLDIIKQFDKVDLSIEDSSISIFVPDKFMNIPNSDSSDKITWNIRGRYLDRMVAICEKYAISDKETNVLYSKKSELSDLIMTYFSILSVPEGKEEEYKTLKDPLTLDEIDDMGGYLSWGAYLYVLYTSMEMVGKKKLML